ncbi:MAG TPA: hypothetical protein PKK00_07460 [Bacteroidales bacterium]|nr:hypothetical protein [Bacteroidales bacterium]HPS17256.1 hypothetical protein [Bacteroidales bacterium]
MVTGLKLFILSFGVLFYSCAGIVPIRVKKNFTLCYDSNANNNHSKIQMNGYYMFINNYRYTYDYNGKLTDTVPCNPTYHRIIFFKDGIVVKGQFGGLKCANCDTETTNQFLKMVSQNKQPETSVFYGYNWGVYKVIGDTIKMQTVNSQTWPNPYWYLFENWYLINNDSSLSPIYSKNLIDDKEIRGDAEIPKTYKFIETNLQLPSDTWLKKEKWFWCNKEDWKIYIKNKNK